MYVQAPDIGHAVIALLCVLFVSAFIAAAAMAFLAKRMPKYVRTPKVALLFVCSLVIAAVAILGPKLGGVALSILVSWALSWRLFAREEMKNHKPHKGLTIAVCVGSCWTFGLLGCAAVFHWLLLYKMEI